MRYKCTNGANRIHEVSIRRYVRFHSLKTNLDWKILKKILRNYLCSLGIRDRILCSRRYSWSLSTCIRALYGSQLLARIITGPSNKEFYAGSYVMITTMCYDISDHKFLLVLQSNFLRIDSLRIEDKGSQIVKYMDCFRPLT